IRQYGHFQNQNARPDAWSFRLIPKSLVRLLSNFALSKEKIEAKILVIVTPGKKLPELSQRHIKRHHDLKSENGSQRSFVFMLFHLRFRNKLLNYNKDHSAYRKVYGIGQQRLHKQNSGCSNYACNRFDSP